MITARAALWGLALIPFCLCYPLDGTRDPFPRPHRNREAEAQWSSACSGCGSLRPWHVCRCFCIRAEVKQLLLLCLQWLTWRAAPNSPKSTKSRNFTVQMQLLAYFCRTVVKCLCIGQGIVWSGREGEVSFQKCVIMQE